SVGVDASRLRRRRYIEEHDVIGVTREDSVEIPRPHRFRPRLDQPPDLGEVRGSPAIGFLSHRSPPLTISHASQSVVSHHVAAPEREFGRPLVDRGTRPVSVTDAGHPLLRHTEAALGYITAAEDELRAVAGLEGGTLRIGAFLSAANSFVPSALARFEAP